MEIEEAPHQSEPPQAIERAYPVGLRPAVFSYFAEGLRPVYQDALMGVQQEGSFEELQKFHGSSQIARLMGQMLDQFENPDELPQNPTLSLTSGDMGYLETVIPHPTDAGQSRLRTEMFRELKENYNAARAKSQIGGFINKLKSKFRR